MALLSLLTRTGNDWRRHYAMTLTQQSWKASSIDWNINLTVSILTLGTVFGNFATTCLP